MITNFYRTFLIPNSRIDAIAKENHMSKCANVILLGMASKFIEILSPEQLRESIGRVFAAKGEATWK